MEAPKNLGSLSHLFWHTDQCTIKRLALFVSVDQIRQSASNCLSCQLNLEVVLRCSSSSAPVSEQPNDSCVRPWFGDLGRPQMSIAGFDGLVDFFTADVTSAKLLPFFPTSSRAPHVPAGDTSSDSSLTLAMQWLDNCTMSHPECGSGSPTFLPTRILDLHASTIRLVHAAKDTARYACLSHCWGSKSMLKTTMESLSRFQEAIPWDELPPTFQDAISFTRRLGLRYIWIDSICIIQDDTSVPSDWEKESARMASIYQNAYVTLAATTSADSTGGCYTRPSQQEHFAHEMQCLRPSLPPGCAVYARLRIPHVTESRDRSSFPLLQRAWVYQERLLSPRVIHFAGFELQFECSCVSTCECESVNMNYKDPDSRVDMKMLYKDQTRSVPDSSRPKCLSVSKLPSTNEHELCNHDENSTKASLQYGRWALSINLSSIQPPPPGEITRARIPSISWRTLVREYSKLELTYQDDVFPALSGLARSWHTHHRSRYFAGLWEDSLIHDLLWMRSWFDRPAGVLARAPSWSWASIERITYWHRSFSHDITHQKHLVVDGTSISKVHCQHGPDWAGQVQSGYIELKSRAIAAAVIYWPDPLPEDRGFHRSRLVVDDIWLDQDAFSFDVAVWDPQSIRYLESESTVFLLPLTFATPSTTPDYVESSDMGIPYDDLIQCIIVRWKTDPDGRRVCERIGYAYLSPDAITRQVLASEIAIKWEDDPDYWMKELRHKDNEAKRKWMGADVSIWRYDEYCKLVKKIIESPIQDFTIV